MLNNYWFHVIKEFLIVLLILIYLNSLAILIDEFKENVYLMVIVDMLLVGSLILILSKLTRFTGNLSSTKIFKYVVKLIFAFVLINSLLATYISGAIFTDNIGVFEASNFIVYLSIIIFSGCVVYEV